MPVPLFCLPLTPSAQETDRPADLLVWLLFPFPPPLPRSSPPLTPQTWATSKKGRSVLRDDSLSFRQLHRSVIFFFLLRFYKCREASSFLTFVCFVLVLVQLHSFSWRFRPILPATDWPLTAKHRPHDALLTPNLEKYFQKASLYVFSHSFWHAVRPLFFYFLHHASWTAGPALDLVPEWRENAMFNILHLPPPQLLLLPAWSRPH